MGRKSSTGNTLLTVMTYNVHSCVNIFGRLNPAAIARVIAAVDPDVAALQEVEYLPPPHDGLPPCNQARWMADRLKMHFRFYPLRRARWGGFGLALLSKKPLVRIKTARLPHASGSPIRESRGAMWYQLDTSNGPVQIVNTHLALYPRDRRHQIGHLLGREWLGHVSPEQPVVFCGDFNAGVRSPVYRAAVARFVDVQRRIRQWRYPRSTFHSIYPVLRLDHIFVSDHLTPSAVKVPFSLEAKTASDHLPVCVQLDWPCHLTMRTVI